MKILLTLFEIQDYGGIVGDIEFLIKGLREHGHEVDFVMLRNVARDPYIRKAEGPKGSYASQTGGEVHTLGGWYGVLVMGYGNEYFLRKYQDFANGYDLIIHEIPNPKPEGLWRELYDVKPPQVIAAHDAHFRDMYPYIREIAHKVKGISCTNHAGYNALSWFPGPRAFIGAAHQLADWDKLPLWDAKSKQAVCAHVWKAWKHMELVVAAAPHLKDAALVMGGDGIEGRYMRSKDKCKPKYKGLWDAFLDTEHQYRGLMTHEELYEEYKYSRLMVDMSFSRKFYALGNHFNRSILEAGNMGCISICTSENMAPTNEQVVLFEDGVTHIGVPHNITPESLASIMDWAVNIHADDANQMIANVRKILADHFDYRKVCLEYIKLAEGKPAGIYPILETGAWPESE